jgi:Putative heavy-metal-binding
MRNVLGGRSKSYENGLTSGVSDSLVELAKQAEQLGADAVIGVGIDYEWALEFVRSHGRKLCVLLSPSACLRVKQPGAGRRSLKGEGVSVLR